MRGRAQGETLGSWGESGSGKTTLGLAILRLISSDGPIVFLGSPIAGLTPADAPVPPPHADRVPGSIRLAVAAHVGLRHRRGRFVGAPSEAHQRATRRACDPGAARCGAGSRHPLSLSARILRRPAPAHRGGTRGRAGADLRRARRADERARHVGPGADRRSAARRCRSGAISPTCSSPTICGWWRRWRAGWW